MAASVCPEINTSTAGHMMGQVDRRENDPVVGLFSGTRAEGVGSLWMVGILFAENPSAFVFSCCVPFGNKKQMKVIFPKTPLV